MKAKFLVIVFLFVSYLGSSQDTLSNDVVELLKVSDFYKSLTTLKMDIKYKIFGDSIGNNLLDSSTEKFISCNGQTFISHLNTVSIVSDSFVFFIDHYRKTATLEKKPVLSNNSVEIAKKLTAFLNQRGRYSYQKISANKVKYKIDLDNIMYDWIEIYIDPEKNELIKMIYKYPESNKVNGVSLLTIEFTNQIKTGTVSADIFSLASFLSFKNKSQGELIPPYKEYRFNSYVY